ncbi:MAG: uracil-DNA glycosylase [Gaiellales bacterium]|nr:uracil-DNA glycosylase [Gaiellales bacterium]
MEVVESSARRVELARSTEEWSDCRDCRLSQGRTMVVVGDGDPDADLMFVGEAPGFHEDKQGIPFVGQAGGLLDELLGLIGLARPDCYIANVIKCRPPGNRDPQPDEIEACEGKLYRQIAIVRPRVIATLGNFSTRLLSGRRHGVSRVHGQARRTTLGGLQVVLFPLYHPAAALYNPRLRPELEADVRRIPALLEHLASLESAPEHSEEVEPAAISPSASFAAPVVQARAADQLELF